MKIYVPTLALVIIVTLGFSAKAQSSFTMTLRQSGNDVVATGSGDFDLTYLSAQASGSYDPQIFGEDGQISLGAEETVEAYEAITGPSSIGSGNPNIFATSSSGPLAGVVGVSERLIVPSDYVSDTLISDSATWSNTTLSALGVNPGTYVWSWGTNSEDSVTLVVAAPEPSPFWTITLAMLALVAWRRFSYRAATAS